MTRAEYIETIIKIFRAKYKPSEVELEEVKLALEMMPDREVLLFPQQPVTPKPWEQPTVVMYGCSMPYTSWNDSSGVYDAEQMKEEK